MWRQVSETWQEHTTVKFNPENQKKETSNYILDNENESHQEFYFILLIFYFFHVLIYLCCTVK